MFSYLELTGILILFSSSVSDTTEDVSYQWLNNLVQSIKDSNKYQVLLTINTKANRKSHQEPINEIITKFNSNFPTLYTDLTNPTLETLSSILTLNDSQATTLFIMISDLIEEKEEELFEDLDFLIQLSPTEVRPHCLLIIFSEKNSSYNNLLKQSWSRRFLDLTILDLVKSQEKEGNFVSEKNIKKYVPMIHSFNPFSKVYSKKRCSTKTIWFPDKLLNLHEYKMKVGLFHRPPHVFLKRNTSNDPIHFCGTDVEKLLALSKAINFKIDLVPSEKEDFGKFDCDKSKTNGFLYQLFHNEIQFIVVRSMFVSSCNNHLADFIIIGNTDLSALVPTRIIGKNFFQDKWKMYSLVLIFLFFLVIWLLSIVLKFDSELWTVTYTVQAIFGATVFREPKKLKERFVFGSILIVSAMCSSTIFGVLTELSLKIEPKSMLNSLEELEESNIEIQASANIVKALMYNNEGILLKLLQKTVPVGNSNLDSCVEKLLKYGNIACFLRKQVARNFIRVQRESGGDSVMKVIEEPLTTLLEVILMEPGSPYVERFQKVLSHLEEAGLIHKWDHDRRCELSFQLDKEDREVEEKEKMRLSHLLIFILLIGYFFSILVLITEVLIGYVCKSCRN